MLTLKKAKWPLFASILIIICLVVLSKIRGVVIARSEMTNEIESACLTYSLNYSDINIDRSYKYGNIDYYSAEITCEGFSILNGEQMLDFFSSAGSSSFEYDYTLSMDDIVVISDGHLYTCERNIADEFITQTVYCDGTIKSQERAQRSTNNGSSDLVCPNCGTRFRQGTIGQSMISNYGHCQICNGR